MNQFRQAKESDSWAIRALIHRVGINPMGLDWRRFTLAFDENNRVIGCGQIKPHGDGTRELASIAIVPEMQGLGIGTEIIAHLMEDEPLPLYLTCRSVMGPYYQRFGFRQVSNEALPAYFRRIWRFARFLRCLFPKMGELWVMVKKE